MAADLELLGSLTYACYGGHARVHLVRDEELGTVGRVASLCEEVEGGSAGWVLADQRATEDGMCWLCHKAFLRLVRRARQGRPAVPGVSSRLVVDRDRVPVEASQLRSCWRCGEDRKEPVYGRVRSGSGGLSNLAMCRACADGGPWDPGDLVG